MRTTFRHSWGFVNCALLIWVCVKVGRPKELLEDISGSAWLFVACLASYSIYAWLFHLRSFHSPKDERFPRHQVPTTRAAELQWLAGKGRKITSAQAMVFALAVIAPSQLRRRVIEDYVPERRSIRQSALVEVQLPHNLSATNGGANILIPALVPPKGELHDDLQFYDSSGQQISSLCYREQLTLVASTLRILLMSACAIDENSPDKRLPKNVADIELLALQAIISRRLKLGEQPDTSAAEKLRVLDVPNKAARDIAAELVRRLTLNYAIVIELSLTSDKRTQFRYEQILIPELKLTSQRSKKRWNVAGAVRLGLGARPVDLTIDIANASSCQSYHLHVHAPEGLYLARQEPLGIDKLLRRTAVNAPTPPHCRFRRRLGQSHAHFYSRYMPALQPKESPSLRFRYFEVPPGSTLRALVTALASAAIICLVGFVNSRVADPGTDAPAFLLAFPALAATWLGFGSPTQRLLEGTMSARICLLFTAVLSISAAGLYMAHKTAPSSFQWHVVPHSLSFLGITDLGWGIIASLSVLNAAVVGFRCFTLTWEYASIMTRTPYIRA
ncbi:hypothetical protein [Lentzea sp. NBRC 105346]|uniref:hypothetical protein n=1 Tax=Lentzea sp. NBRC 105346 TaxID=3032205 RepID=UPI0025567C10|nr:hypothetical protein [Lentzea sp. NBRC 105346]